MTVSYIDSESDFTIEFSRIDRNNMPTDDTINGTINDTLSEIEGIVLDLLKRDNTITTAQLVEITGKSQRTIIRTISSLKSKRLIERIGSKKTGTWKVK